MTKPAQIDASDASRNQDARQDRVWDQSYRLGQAKQHGNQKQPVDNA